jgi:hypothetical protein
VACNLEADLKLLAQAKTALSKDQRNHLLAAIHELHQAALHRDAALADQSGLIAIVPARTLSRHGAFL